jgi:hypothetical protein
MKNPHANKKWFQKLQAAHASEARLRELLQADRDRILTDSERAECRVLVGELGVA